jgi:general secretion pathway protein I
MVALAVVAVALPALLVALYQQVDSTAYLRDKSLARLVAANKLEELRILSHARQSLFSGSDSGTTQLAEREWYWWLQSSETEVPGFYRIEIDVALEEEQREQSLFTLVGFMSAEIGQEVPPGAG